MTETNGATWESAAAASAQQQAFDKRAVCTIAGKERILADDEHCETRTLDVTIDDARVLALFDEAYDLDAEADGELEEARDAFKKAREAAKEKRATAAAKRKLARGRAEPKQVEVAVLREAQQLIVVRCDTGDEVERRALTYHELQKTLPGTVAPSTTETEPAPPADAESEGRVRRRRRRSDHADAE